jgi:hypothetical protein
MWSYFKPLRRKIGVATLVLACVFATGWVRSLIVCDGLLPPWGPGELWSKNGAMILVTSILPRDPQASTSFEWLRYPLADARFIYENGSFGCSWRFEFVQSGICDCSLNGPRVVFTVYKLWYGFITIPLTLLSAWLLLSKPQEKKSTIEQQASA